MNKLTLQINNLEALERLIGGDSEIEIEIRNSVVQSFAEKHLKALANSEKIKTTFEAIKAVILEQTKQKLNESIASFQTSWQGSLTDIKLHSSIKQEIDRQVRLLTDDKLRDAVTESLKFWMNDAELKKRIDNRFEYYTQEMINNIIRSRIEVLKKSL